MRFPLRAVRALALLSTAAFPLAAASTAQAADLTTAQQAIVIAKDDVTTMPGRVTGTDANDMGRTLPSSCTPLSSGRGPDGLQSQNSYYGEVDFATATWESTVWTYADSARAAASFAKLRTGTLARCTGDLTGLIGDDGPDMPAVQAQRARALPSAAGMPRFAWASSTILLDPAHARPGYTNTFNYTVYTRAGNAVIELNVFGKRPITSAQRAQANALVTTVAKRYLRHPA